jgi:hypothetical protein
VTGYAPPVGAGPAAVDRRHVVHSRTAAGCAPPPEVDRVSGMDYATAAERALRALHDCPNPEGEPVQVALELTLRGWQLCDPRGVALVDWDLFGTGVEQALRNLCPTREPFEIMIDDTHLADTPAVRATTAQLVAAVAARLDTAAGQPGADPHRRWPWASAAARLRMAAAELAADP